MGNVTVSTENTPQLVSLESYGDNGSFQNFLYINHYIFLSLRTTSINLTRSISVPLTTQQAQLYLIALITAVDRLLFSLKLDSSSVTVRAR